MKEHLTETDFLNGIYELDSTGGDHLQECAECGAKWSEWQARRRSLLRDPQVPAAWLASQREKIEQRVANPNPAWIKWSPALAAAGMALVVVLWRPAPAPQHSAVRLSDAQLMSEIYETVYHSEPSAVEPLRGLFETKTETKK